MLPVYFVPGNPAISAAKVRDLGLGYLLDGRRGIASVGMTRGPLGGGGGVAFTLAPCGSIADLASGAQWEPYPGRDDGLLIGFNPKDLPSPEELAREDALDGHPVRLADGRDWLMPVARYIDGASPLPRTIKLNGSGWIQGDVVEAYRELWQGGCRLWAQLLAAGEEGTDGDAVEFSVSDAATLASLGLSANYRISAAEVSAFGLLTTAAQRAAVLAIIDWPSLPKLQEAADPN